MSFPRVFLAPVALLAMTAALVAQDKKPTVSPLLTATGVVDKADKESLTVTLRGDDGKFQKGFALKVTGTSKVSVASQQTREGKVVLTQREVGAKDLTAGQSVAVIYTEAGKGEFVLLAAVAHTAPAK